MTSHFLSLSEDLLLFLPLPYAQVRPGPFRAKSWQLLNIGPRTERQLNAVNIFTVQELRDVGALEAWRRLKRAYPTITDGLTLYRLQGALLGVHWKELAGNFAAQKEQGE